MDDKNDHCTLLLSYNIGNANYIFNLFYWSMAQIILLIKN